MAADNATHHTYALELRDLRKSFGKTEIIRGANLCVAPGERVAIIGPNGAGKSTLFNLISGRFAPTSGDVILNGQRINGLPPYEINRQGLSRSFQITNIFPKLSVFENLRCGVLWSMGYRYTFLRFLSGLHDANRRATELMEMIKLDHKRDILAMNLTYAEQRALGEVPGGMQAHHEPHRARPGVAQAQQQAGLDGDGGGAPEGGAGVVDVRPAEEHR